MTNEEKFDMPLNLLKEFQEISLKIRKTRAQTDILISKATETDDPKKLMTIFEELSRIEEETMGLERRLESLEIFLKTL